MRQRYLLHRYYIILILSLQLSYNSVVSTEWTTKGYVGLAVTSMCMYIVVGAIAH